MTAAIAAGRRLFPRGYADLGYQLLIWFGFLAAYQLARGVADRDPTRAFANVWRVIDLEQRFAGLVELASNPYAAMPSLHSADALIAGVILASLVRRPVWKAVWLLWPAWVWFAVMATGNHFWLDVLAGILVATVAMAVVYRPPARKAIARLL